MLNQVPTETARFARSAFFDKTYEEALALIEDAQIYLTAVVEEPAGKPATDRDRGAAARHALATTRLTSRIGHIMAWLLYQKAVAKAETGPDGGPLKPPRTLADWPLLEAEDGADAGLPAVLVELMARSHELFRRVKRLQAQLERPDHAVPASVRLFAELSEGWARGEGSS